MGKLKYSKDHEWVKIDGDRAYIGITDHAQKSLGDIVFVELPEVDVELDAGDQLAVVESVKAASDVYSPISGTVIEVNEELDASPELINENAYDSWIAILSIKDVSELDELMDETEYEKFCKEED
ncbi:glycine cleavage system protein GcvH [Xylanivirga thermophila]|jgi:glycine cleavage system H protein|uniref:glycine cleavage system protein GcvH n=1 Tax=Xylanivirga thermophila TaxID=2496273 RepID=UPI00101B8B6E|nr:glycine cleavage system protein GcvH [Xylanivirga thermophila]